MFNFRVRAMPRAGVVVGGSGVCRDRVLRLDIPQSDLDLAARYINENFRAGR